MKSKLNIFVLFCCLAILSPLSKESVQAADGPVPIQKTEIPTAENHTQPIRYYAPEQAKENPVPLLVFLHSWSGNYSQANTEWFEEARDRDWAIVHPNFQGPNFQPTACGSELAQQEILDSIDFMTKNYQIDPTRIYLAGTSGGGHMSMLMAAKHPERFSAVSAWVGISDLNAWYAFHTKNGEPKGYALNVKASCGGQPGESDEIDAEYRARSPLFHLSNTGDLAVDIAAGIHDGHTGSVPVSHSLNAFNIIAQAHDSPIIPEDLIETIVATETVPDGVPALDSVSEIEESYPRKVHLRRTAGPSRVTIFEGGHEGLVSPALEWLSKHRRETKAAEN
ncbi:MAG: prolyl oligopeptidase family serine peptidase [Planctomycetaceae bacterium]|nr:prolyl oligopeptidase family serine peptidase [Planctomycetaceae bacterium]